MVEVTEAAAAATATALAVAAALDKFELVETRLFLFVVEESALALLALCSEFKSCSFEVEKWC
mgnify:CR=1 FL=1